MKRIGIIAYSGVAAAFVAAAVSEFIKSGADIEGMTPHEVLELAIEQAPPGFPIYEARTAPEQPRFNGYMKRANRRR